MELETITRKVKCFVPGCKAYANYHLEIKKNYFIGNHYYCKDCLNKMYALIGKEIVPPSIKSAYKKNTPIKEDK